MSDGLAGPIHVVVVTYNSADVIGPLLRSLPAGLDGRAWSLTVVDNDSSDASLEVVAEGLPAAELVSMGRNAGYAAAINAAVARRGVDGPILVLNPDVELHPGCIGPLLAALEQPQVGISGPRLSDGAGRLIMSMRREPTVMRAYADALIGGQRAGRWPLLGEVVTDLAQYDTGGPCDWAQGSFMLIHPECWRACGPWEESYFLYSEETDFALRAKDFGFATVLVPDARATHIQGGSATSTSLWPLVALNKVRLYQRRHGTMRTAPYWGALVLRELIRSIGPRSRSRAALRALVSPVRLREVRGPESIRVRA